METLLAVVEAGSFSAASRKLGTPLPTVSRRVSELEAHVGTRLLIRSTRRLRLTEPGQAYVAAVKRIVHDVHMAERAASGEYVAPRGELDVTAPVVFGRLHLLPLVSDFLARYPDIDVRLILSDRNAHLIDDQLDVAVRIGPLPDSALVATPVGRVRRVVCASPRFLAAHGTPRQPDELSGLPCVTFDVLGAPTAWSFRRAGARTEQAVALRSRLAVNTAEAAIDAALSGVGVTRVLSYQVEEALARGELRIVLSEFESEPLPVHLLHAGQLPLPLKTRAFLDFVAPSLRARLGGARGRPRSGGSGSRRGPR